MLATLLTTTSCLFLSNPIIEAEGLPITYWRTTAPSANNSTFQYFYGHYQSGITDIYDAQVDLDDNKTDLYTYLSGVSQTTTTNDFTHNDTWLDHGEGEYNEVVGFMPYEDATLLSVNILVRFTVWRPSLQFGYSLNNGSSWTYSQLYSEPGTALPVFSWNVTALEDWTPAMLNTSDLCAKMITYPTAGVHYYLDYLGWLIDWCGEYEGGGDHAEPEEEDETPEGDFDSDTFFMTDNIIGIMGTVGMIGMILTPTAGILIYRTGGHDAIPLFIQMMVLFMFCCTMTLYSLS